MNKKMNNTEELSVNIEYCPYCGSNNVGREDDSNCYCEDCGRDFLIMTHEQAKLIFSGGDFMKDCLKCKCITCEKISSCQYHSAYAIGVNGQITRDYVDECKDYVYSKELDDYINHQN